MSVFLLLAPPIKNIDEIERPPICKIADLVELQLVNHEVDGLNPTQVNIYLFNPEICYFKMFLRDGYLTKLKE